MLKTLKLDLKEELKWAREFSKENPKNYQVWHHRQCLVTLMNDECDELNCMIADFQSEPKNYHAWQYRQWLVQHYGADCLKDEMALVDELLRLDPYNNSAWNHRFFLHFSGYLKGVDLNDSNWWDREAAFVQSKLAIDDDNDSPKAYLHAMVLKRKALNK